MAPLAGGDMLIMRHSADWLRIPCDGSDPVSLAPLADFRTHTRPLRQMADGRLFIGESDLTSSFGGSWLSPDPTLSEVPIEGVSYRLPDDDGTVWSSESGTADVIGYDESGARRHQVASAGFLVATLESGFVMADLGGTGNDSIYCHADPDAAPTELTGAATFEGDPLLYSRMTIPATRDGVFLLPFGTYSGYSGSGPGCRNALRGKLAAFTCADGHRFDIPFRAPGNGSSCLTLRGPYVQRTTGGDFVAYANADVSPGVSLGSTTSGGVVGVFDASSGAERWTRAVGLAEAAAGPNDTVWVAHEEGVAVYDAPTGALLAGNAPSN